MPQMTDIAVRCRTLADYHAGTDLAERIRSAFDVQREQRLALAQAAEEIERLRLSAKEREAIEAAATVVEECEQEMAATLRGLLEKAK